MAKARFESYVEERVKELAAPRRAKLQAAYDAEKARVDERFGKYAEMVKQGVDALIRKVFAKAKADGCNIQIEPGEAVEPALTCSLENRLKEALGLVMKYDYEKGGNVWPEGTAVRRAQDALEAFDALCAREARRIVVYRMDLGMKPEAFERMLAETAMKINGSEME